MFKGIILILVSSMLYADMTHDIIERTKQIEKTQKELNVKKALDGIGTKTQEKYKKLQNDYKKNNKYSNVVIYFTSQSLRASEQINLTREVARYNKNGLNAKIAPITRGFNNGVYEHARLLYEEVSKLPPMQQADIKSATRKLRVNPKIFRDFNITSVPTIITASCRGGTIKKDSCIFHYKATGRTSLMKISELTKVSINDLFRGVNNE